MPEVGDEEVLVRLREQAKFYRLPGDPEDVLGLDFLLRARPLAAWHQEMGPAFWWRFPVDEPPYTGSPMSRDWPGYHTHWTPIVPPIQSVQWHIKEQAMDISKTQPVPLGKRGYLPEIYVDELCPPERLSPNDWVRRLEDGTYAMEKCEPDLTDEEEPLWVLTEGCRVEFAHVVRHGGATVTLSADPTRGLEVDRPPPDGVNTINSEEDMDSIWSSLGEIEQEWRDRGPDPDDILPKKIDVSYNEWGDRHEIYEFRAGEFHLVGEA